VLLSGGVGSPEDVARVYADRHSNVVGVITGRALYEGKLDLAKLVAKYLEPADSGAW
jgi:phosphoribosylformimino-5-aminoimidazole carboxamide ribotide isomerase